MASIFNLFGDINESSKHSSLPGQMKSLSRPNSVVSIERSPLKAGPSNTKPKGLSIRSNSDLNVSTSNARLTNSHSQKQDCLKLKSTSLQSLSVSPKNKTILTKKQSTQSKFKKPAEKTFQKIQSDESAKVSEEAIFKRPQTPRKTIKKSEYPTPENLAPYCDMEYEFNNICNIRLENDLKKLGISIRNSIIQPYKDEGFESEPEEVPLPTVPEISILDRYSDDKYEMDFSVDLPEILDNDIDF